MREDELLVLLRGSLQNTAEESGSSVDYGKGVVVGVVTTLIFVGNDFDKAYDIMYDCLPKDFRLDCIPEAWQGGENAASSKSHV